MAETLRLELAPFQVKVLSVVTGAVQTQGQTYFGDFELPKNSLYKPIETTIASRARGQDGVPRMDLMVYCNEVVSKLTSGETGRIWCGNNAEMTKNSISSVSNTMRVCFSASLFESISWSFNILTATLRCSLFLGQHLPSDDRARQTIES